MPMPIVPTHQVDGHANAKQDILILEMGMVWNAPILMNALPRNRHVIQMQLALIPLDRIIAIVTKLIKVKGMLAPFVQLTQPGHPKVIMLRK